MNAIFARGFENAEIRSLHNITQPFVNLLLAPRERLQSLHPLKVRNGDPAGVGKNVRQHQDSTIEQDRVRAWRGGTICGLSDDLRLNQWGVAFGDLTLQGCRNQNLAINLENLLIRDVFRLSKIHHRAGSPFVDRHSIEIETLRIVDASPRITHRNNRGVMVGHQPSRHRSRIAETLNGRP